MFTKSIKFFIMLFFIGIVGSVNVALAETWHEFSADMVTTANGQTMAGKIFVTKEKTRVEMPQSIMITRLDKKLAWVIMPGEKMYMEHPMDPTMIAKVSKEMPGETERVSMGPEPVDGHPAQKFKITYTQGSKQESVYQWVGESDIPLKVQSLDGRWTVEYKNLNLGAQDDSLFEVPAGYEKFTMPVMPAGMSGMMGGGKAKEE